MHSKQGFYIPSLDGIRATAAMLVFVSHCGLAHLVPGGFGVQIFFFLSGYLITTLLRMEFDQTQTISFKNFYLRRVYRIFPPMYLIFFVILLASTAGLIPGSQVRPNAVVAQIFHLTNYYLIENHVDGLVPFTGVFWSLAIEEHFYLIFPVMFLVAARRLQYRRFAQVLLALCAVVLAWRFILVYRYDASWLRIYYATDTRLDGLLFGCIMGIFFNPVLDDQELFDSKSTKVAALVIALGTLLFTLLYRDEDFRQTWRYTVQGLALFPIFWLAVRHPEWPAFRWLNWMPIRWLGVISYVFYLSHLFWLDVAHKVVGGPLGPTVAGLAFVLTVLFSLLMYWQVERPFAAMRRKLKTSE